MLKITLSPSILEYESNLAGNLRKISALADSGITNLHIDVMRPPFIPGRTAFSDECLANICDAWIDDFNLDFHLMMNAPDEVFDALNSAIPENKRKKCIITLHREAYRDHSPEKGLGKYAKKEHDLSRVIKTVSEDSQIYKRIADTQIRSENMLHISLSTLKSLGYNTGIAVEPNTSNVSKSIIYAADMILLMSVHSGRSGQEFIPATLAKITEIRRQFPKKSIQVDGGINAFNLGAVIDAGADNIVVGSYINCMDDPTDHVIEIKEIIAGYEMKKLLTWSR